MSVERGDVVCVDPVKVHEGVFVGRRSLSRQRAVGQRREK